MHNFHEVFHVLLGSKIIYFMRTAIFSRIKLLINLYHE